MRKITLTYFCVLSLGFVFGNKDSNTELSQVLNIENMSSSRVKTNAESIVALNNEYQYLKYAEGLNTSSAIGMNDQMNQSQKMKSSFEVYPNPSEGEMIIKAIEAKGGKIVITDGLGRVHLEATLNNNGTIPTSLETGIYIIHFTDEMGVSETKQVFIQK